VENEAKTNGYPLSYKFHSGLFQHVVFSCIIVTFDVMGYMNDDNEDTNKRLKGTEDQNSLKGPLDTPKHPHDQEPHGSDELEGGQPRHTPQDDSHVY
jgi:hypothetical protein